MNLVVIHAFEAEKEFAQINFFALWNFENERNETVKLCCNVRATEIMCLNVSASYFQENNVRFEVTNARN